MKKIQEQWKCIQAAGEAKGFRYSGNFLWLESLPPHQREESCMQPKDNHWSTRIIEFFGVQEKINTIGDHSRTVTTLSSVIFGCENVYSRDKISSFSLYAYERGRTIYLLIFVYILLDVVFQVIVELVHSLKISVQKQNTLLWTLFCLLNPQNPWSFWS